MVQIRLAKAGTHYIITKPKKVGCSVCTTFFGLFFSPSYSAAGGTLSVKRAARHSGRQIYFAIAKTTSTIFLPNASAASGVAASEKTRIIGSVLLLRRCTHSVGKSILTPSVSVIS